MNKMKIHLKQNHHSKQEANRMNPPQTKVRTVLNSVVSGIHVYQAIFFLTVMTASFAIIS